MEIERKNYIMNMDNINYNINNSNNTSIATIINPNSNNTSIATNINPNNIKSHDTCNDNNREQNKIIISSSSSPIASSEQFEGTKNKSNSDNINTSNNNNNDNINNNINNKSISDNITTQPKLKNKPKTIYFYSSMGDKDYYSSISSYFASNLPIIKQETKNSNVLILEKFNNSMDTADSDGDNDSDSSSGSQSDKKKTILYIKSCGARRLNYDSFQNDIESLASNQNHIVILVIILIGSNAEAILIDYPGYKIFFNTFQNKVCENDFNKESLKTLCRLIN
ncbi:hypothetical protein DICPUDRAFT_84150 [Dictyostelium purpureum]|uniref:Uncharacterized protein n=1 Tax=Dictyostelium purpureum TaxID=5786 RepID=F1A1Q7_DICPU|nr:uncharacterized protein DICPUDRAFT_84150 [Dictyostelium purpureum]EGC29864.1 hypothetical protein DICPUDRAFT_84150 [Dictyostelium purpureum]|eukprot:XP_003293601.1 hypothetical protein DICPUDRAFT_84150 [Dictyostelium purpureum]